jgi:hypothetical protein
MLPTWRLQYIAAILESDGRLVQTISSDISAPVCNNLTKPVAIPPFAGSRNPTMSDNRHIVFQDGRLLVYSKMANFCQVIQISPLVVEVWSHESRGILGIHEVNCDLVAIPAVFIRAYSSIIVKTFKNDMKHCCQARNNETRMWRNI